MSIPYEFTIDSAAALASARTEIGSLPRRIATAKKRAMRKLMTWLRRQVLREAAKSVGVTQKALRAALRYRATRTQDSISIWIGTNPLKAHQLGTVRWTRRMRGARVGRRLFAGTFAWSNPAKTSGQAVVFRRVDAPRLPIEPETVAIHDTISRRITGMQGEIAERFSRLMAQELRYALQVEGTR